jgi:hypothetical protein
MLQLHYQYTQNTDHTRVDLQRIVLRRSNGENKYL